MHLLEHNKLYTLGAGTVFRHVKSGIVYVKETPWNINNKHCVDIDVKIVLTRWQQADTGAIQEAMVEHSRTTGKSYPLDLQKTITLKPQSGSADYYEIFSQDDVVNIIALLRDAVERRGMITVNN
jgi:hypothetical protein